MAHPTGAPAPQRGRLSDGSRLQRLAAHTQAPYPTLAQHTASYQSIPGVLGAAMGHIGDTTADQQSLTIPLAITAVDSQTFAPCSPKLARFCQLQYTHRSV
jgi:hypothetical protein